MRWEKEMKFKSEFLNGTLLTHNDIIVNFEESLLSCLWKEKEFNCSHAFMNHINDVGICFTFNPGYSMALNSLEDYTGRLTRQIIDVITLLFNISFSSFYPI